MNAPLRVWPPDYASVLRWRIEKKARLEDVEHAQCANAYYKDHPVEFIEHWGITYDPRNIGTDKPTFLPFILFQKQRELVQFLEECLKSGESGLIEKSRDMGATWVCVAFSVWLWLYKSGSAVGWGSRKSALVDTRGVMDSIFEKIRAYINWLPRQLKPTGFDPGAHLLNMRVINPENDATIAGEGGDDIGRGGRKTIYFKDESAHYEHPEQIEASLSNNTNCQIDISSVHGIGNVFHRRREAGVEWHPGATDLPKGKTRILVMDWRDHPGKSQEWYDAARTQKLSEGLAHIWAQEVDRNYGASVIGTIIPSEWVKSAIDAHIVLGFLDDGRWGAALDVSDEGGDTNALAKRKGVVLRSVEEWAEGDTGDTTRRAVAALQDCGQVELQYDCIGVGAGVKAEWNRLVREGVAPRAVALTPWNAGGGVLYPERYVIPGDRSSPKNEDFYANLKAQGWWMLRRRFENTHRARTRGIRFDPDDMISIDSTIPLLRKLEKELSQPTMGYSSKLKMLVNKRPEGTKSPNLADAVMMCYWPLPYRGPIRFNNDVISRI